MSSEYPGRELEAMSFAINYHRWILGEFRPYVAGTVAEVGAGIGDFSELLLELNLESLHSYEPAANLFSTLQSRLAGQPRTHAVNDFFNPLNEDEPFDTIIYVNVLEHIADEKGELRRAFQGLRPGGHLLVFVPAMSWLFSNADGAMGHLRRYARRELVDVAESAGFDILKCRYFDIAGVIPWYLYFVLLKKDLSQGPVSLYDRWVVPVTRGLERIVSPPLGKNLILIARKPG